LEGLKQKTAVIVDIQKNEQDALGAYFTGVSCKTEEDFWITHEWKKISRCDFLNDVEETLVDTSVKEL
jgi:hypothetical protein